MLLGILGLLCGLVAAVGFVLVLAALAVRALDARGWWPR